MLGFIIDTDKILEIPRFQCPQISHPPPIPPAVEVQGDAYFLQIARQRQIPPDQSRTCPQCRQEAWRRSRWCWNCKFDFDRAARPRLHVFKVLCLSIFANCLLAAILAAVIWACSESKRIKSASSEAQQGKSQC